jgi:hypothetical protein
MARKQTEAERILDVHIVYLREMQKQLRWVKAWIKSADIREFKYSRLVSALTAKPLQRKAKGKGE